MTFLTTSHGAVDGIGGGTVKRSVWRWVRALGDTSLVLDFTSYSNVVKERNPNITMFYVSSNDNELKTEANKMSTGYDVVLPVPHPHTLHFFKSINDQKLSTCENSSGDSFTAVSIFKITEQEAEEDNEEGKIIGENISETFERRLGTCQL